MRSNKTTLILLLTLAVTSSSPRCPKYCTCESNGTFVAATCTSVEFVVEATRKQLSSIDNLTLQDSSMKQVDLRLGKLKNLVLLDLSRNNIHSTLNFPRFQKLKTLKLGNNRLTSISFSNFPISLKDLDISRNEIKSIPEDWNSLKALKFLHVHGNPIACDSKSVGEFIKIVSVTVKIPEDTVCHSPKNFKGQLLQTVITETLLNTMSGDQAVTESDDNDEHDIYIRSDDHPTNTKTHSDRTSTTPADLFEGSGFEGSGYSDEDPPPACIINCSTISPLGDSNEESASPLMSLKEQFSIFVEDLFGSEEPVIPRTKDKNVSKTGRKGTSPNTASVPAKEVQPDLITSDKDGEATAESNSTIPGGLERPSMSNEGNSYTYYLIGAVLFIMIAIIVFISLRRRSSRKNNQARGRNSMTENGICEEMKPLEKYNVKSNGINDDDPETAPFLNNRNGKNVDPEHGSETDGLLRPKAHIDSLTPQLERVTVVSSEIPDSIKKTPQLVHRELNSAGEIITREVDP